MKSWKRRIFQLDFLPFLLLKVIVQTGPSQAQIDAAEAQRSNRGALVGAAIGARNDNALAGAIIGRRMAR